MSEHCRERSADGTVRYTAPVKFGRCIFVVFLSHDATQSAVLL